MIKYGIRQIATGLFYSRLSGYCDGCEDNATLVDRIEEARSIHGQAQCSGRMLDPHEVVSFAPTYCPVGPPESL